MDFLPICPNFFLQAGFGGAAAVVPKSALEESKVSTTLETVLRKLPGSLK
ncbi:MAG: hypothetical protein ACK481_01755 [Candidatus Melainabacteria bacterium]